MVTRSSGPSILGPTGRRSSRRARRRDPRHEQAGDPRRSTPTAVICHVDPPVAGCGCGDPDWAGAFGSHQFPVLPRSPNRRAECWLEPADWAVLPIVSAAVPCRRTRRLGTAVAAGRSTGHRTAAATGDAASAASPGTLGTRTPAAAGSVAAAVLTVRVRALASESVCVSVAARAAVPAAGSIVAAEATTSITSSGSVPACRHGSGRHRDHRLRRRDRSYARDPVDRPRGRHGSDRRQSCPSRPLDQPSGGTLTLCLRPNRLAGALPARPPALVERPAL